MTSVSVSYGNQNPTHDISLSDGSTTYGLIFAGGPRVLQEVPLSPPAQQFENEQRDWTGGRGRLRYADDPTGYFDDFFLWSTTEGKLFPSLQWRFATGIRNSNTSLPADNSNIAWWKLYGSVDTANKISRYHTISFANVTEYAADKGYLIVRRRGTPGTLTFELCSNDNGGAPGTILQTVTKTTSDITDTLSVYQLFDWTSTETLAASTTYFIKIYGASSDSSSNHWQVLVNSSGSSSQCSANGTAWTTGVASLFFRITDADTARQWMFFTLEGALYAASKNDAGGAPTLKNNGVRGTATAATATTLTCSALSMTTNEYVGAYIWIYDGLGETQIRQISSNTGTQFTVPTWSVTPDTTSRFIVYYTDAWSTTTGTHGLTHLFSKPVSTGTIAYFPHSPIRRMRVNANSHDFAAESAYAHVLGTAVEGVTLKVYAGAIKVANATTWGTNLTFGANKPIGTADYRITNIFFHNRQLYIFKEDGLYVYANNAVEKQGSNFSDAPDRYMGTGVAAQNHYLWFGWSHSAERMFGSSIDDMLNFKAGYEGMPSNRRGNISCIVSAVGWLFFVVDGGDSNFSSIIVWNGLGWHEIFRGWAAGVRIRNAYWQPNIDAKGRLWFDIGGDLAFIEFPQRASNPLKDSTINYHWEGAVVTSTYDAHDANLYKILQTLRVFSEAGSAEIDYQTNANVGTNTWTVLGTADSQPVEDLDLNLGGIFQIRFRFRLQVTNTRTASILTGWQLSGRMQPLSKYQYLCTFAVATGNDTKTSETDHDPNTVYTQLVTWAETQTKLTMRTMSQSSDNKVVSITLPSKSVDWIDDESGWGGQIRIAMLET
jgi:hypothetical protein